MVGTPAVLTAEQAEVKVEYCDKPNCNCDKYHKSQNRNQLKNAKKKLDKKKCKICKLDTHLTRECPRCVCRTCGKLLVNHKDNKFCAPTLESKLNGEQRASGMVSKSTMLATVNGDRVMNATKIGSHIVTCEHLWDGPNDQRDVTFTHYLGTFTLSRSACKKVRDDLVMFSNVGCDDKGVDVKGVKIPKIVGLTAIKAEVGLEIFISVYDNEDAAKKCNNKTSSSKIASIAGEDGNEIAYASYSSDNGHCGSPVCDPFGRCAGIHQRGGSQNGFIPFLGKTGSVLTGNPNF
jgi:hypothetical protein